MRECRPRMYEEGICDEFNYMKDEVIDEFQNDLKSLIDILESIIEKEKVIDVINSLYFDEIEDIDDHLIDLIEINGKKQEIIETIDNMKSIFLF